MLFAACLKNKVAFISSTSVSSVMQPTAFFLRLMLVFYALFFVLRLTFLWVYPAEFAGLSFGQILYAFMKGAWYFDTSITLVFLGIPFLIAYLPWRWCCSNMYLKVVAWYAFIVLFFFAFLSIGDLLYFGIVHRHAGHEVGAALNSSALSMVGMIASTYWLYLLVLVLVTYGLSLCWKKWVAQPHSPSLYHLLGWFRVPLFLCMFVLVLLGMRGGIESKPIQVVFAYNEGSMAQGHLTLNGAFSVLHGLEKSKMKTPHYMSQNKAVAISQKVFASSFEETPNPDFPLMRYRRSMLGEMKNKPNIVILLLESWDSDFLDITRTLDGKKPYGITPNFNALAKKGRLYTNFYANGQRSIDGISSVIAGIPTIPYAGTLGEGIESNNLGWLGHIAKNQGYQTSFISGSFRASFYMDKISALAGFDEYLGSEDLLTKLHPDAPKSAWGGWDYDVFMTADQLFKKEKQPFLGMLFSVSTHSPWTLPNEKWQKFPHDSKENKFKNTIYYTDWVLGEFFKAIKNSTYASNTIFVLLGDHASGHVVHPSLKQQHHIPLLMIGPNIEPGIDQTLGGQTDVIPTLIDLAGWKSRYASIGVSLLEAREKRSVLFTRDHMMGIIGEKSILLHNLERAVHYAGPLDEKEDIEQTLKAQIQTLLHTLAHNVLIETP